MSKRTSSASPGTFFFWTHLLLREEMLWRRGEAKRRAHWYLLKDAFTSSPRNPMWDVLLLFLRSLRETAPCPLPWAIGVADAVGPRERGLGWAMWQGTTPIMARERVGVSHWWSEAVARRRVGLTTCAGPDRHHASSYPLGVYGTHCVAPPLERVGPAIRNALCSTINVVSHDSESIRHSPNRNLSSKLLFSLFLWKQNYTLLQQCYQEIIDLYNAICDLK